MLDSMAKALLTSTIMLSAFLVWGDMRAAQPAPKPGEITFHYMLPAATIAGIPAAAAAWNRLTTRRAQLTRAHGHALAFDHTERWHRHQIWRTPEQSLPGARFPTRTP